MEEEIPSGTELNFKHISYIDYIFSYIFLQ